MHFWLEEARRGIGVGDPPPRESGKGPGVDYVRQVRYVCYMAVKDHIILLRASVHIAAGRNPLPSLQSSKLIAQSSKLKACFHSRLPSFSWSSSN